MRGILAAMRRAVSAAAIVLALSCAHVAVYQRQVLDTLYFGTQKADGSVVADADWQSFLATEITPRFPSGLTTFDANGQWRNTTGTIERERTHIVQLVHPPSAADETALRAIISAYKTLFAQEAVLQVRSDACLPR
jgi:hypothetical protein